MLRPLVLAALTLAAAPLAAQEAASRRTPERIRSVTLTGDERCPPSTETEVVVCSRIEPGEQYRIPKRMRDLAEPAAQNQSWVNRAATVDQAGRVAAGLPNTCSAVGTGGQSGCALAAARAWAAERKAAERNDALVPGGE